MNTNNIDTSADYLPIYPCYGEAHKPEVGGMIDNCMICAPEWGKVYAHQACSAAAHWLLSVVTNSADDYIEMGASPIEVLTLASELKTLGLVKLYFRTDKIGRSRHASSVSRYVCELTPHGLIAKQMMSKKGVKRGKR